MPSITPNTSSTRGLTHSHVLAPVPSGLELTGRTWLSLSKGNSGPRGEDLSGQESLTGVMAKPAVCGVVMNIFPDKRTCYSRKKGNREVLLEVCS